MIYWYTAWSFWLMTFLAILLREKNTMLNTAVSNLKSTHDTLRSGSPFPNTQCMVNFPYIYHNLYAKLKVTTHHSLFECLGLTVDDRKKSRPMGPRSLTPGSWHRSFRKWTSWWFHPILKNMRKSNGIISPKILVENNKYLSCHQLVNTWDLSKKNESSWFKVPGSL